MTVEILKPTLSPSALSEYEICGRRGQFYHDPTIPRFTTQGLAQGSAWHAGMETYGRARLQLGDKKIGSLETEELRFTITAVILGAFTEIIQGDDYVSRDDDKLPEQIMDEYQTMIDTWVSDPAIRWMDETTFQVSVEEEVRAEFGSDTHQFRGFIDAVYDTPKGTVGVDYKTAGRAWGGDKAAGDPRKLVQAPLYAEAWLRTTGQEMDWFAYDVMTHAGRFQRVWVDVRPEVRAPFLTKWNDVTVMIETYRQAGLDMPTNPSHFLCSEKWCDFWLYCPMGIDLETRRNEK